MLYFCGFRALYRAISIDPQLRIFPSWNKRLSASFAMLCFDVSGFRLSIASTIAKLLVLMSSVMNKEIPTIVTLFRCDLLGLSNQGKMVASFLQKHKAIRFGHVRSWCRSIFRLLLPSGPYAITWRVSKIIVDSFKRAAMWSVSHIVDKVCKAIYPSLTNTYSTATVSMKRGVPWITASLLHALPDFVKWMVIHAVSSFSHTILHCLHFIQYSLISQRIGVQCKKG